MRPAGLVQTLGCSLLLGFLALQSGVTTVAQETGAAAAPAKTAASKRALTLAEALRKSQGASKSIQYFKADGSKGLLTQPIFDLSRKGKTLQICLLIDGTNSMGGDLESVKQNLREFIDQVKHSQAKIPRAKVAVIVYRDLGSPSGAVKIVTPVDEFGKGEFLSSDDDRLVELLNGIETENGEPSFPEQLDRGLYAAITQLNWLRADDTAKSIIVAGDAPPFPESSMGTRLTQYPQSLRQYTNQQLIQAAKDAQISVFSVLCNYGFLPEYDSDPSSQTQPEDPGRAEMIRIAELYRPEFRDFLQTMANGTGGAVLDLSDTQLVARLISLGAEPVIEQVVELEKVKQEDLDQRKQQQLIRVAVFPPQPLDSLNNSSRTWPDTPARTLARAMVARIQEVDDRGIVPLNTLWDQFALASKSQLTGARLFSNLAAKDGLDFILYGEYESGETEHSVVLKALNRDGVEIAASDRITGSSPFKLAVPAMANLAQKLAQDTTDPARESLRKLLSNPGEDPDAAQFDDDLLAGYFQLEEALEYETGHPEAIRHCEAAREQLLKHPRLAADDALVLFLLSNCERNLGNQAAADDYLTRAFQSPTEISANLKQEIAADYDLLIEKKPELAAEKYEALLKSLDEQNLSYGKQALRAKWTLSGLYLGAWGYEKTDEFAQHEAACLAKARDLILDILVVWPESPESRNYGRYVEPRPVYAPRQEKPSVQQIGFNPGVPVIGARLTPPRGGRVAQLIHRGGGE